MSILLLTSIHFIRFNHPHSLSLSLSYIAIFYSSLLPKDRPLTHTSSSSSSVLLLYTLLFIIFSPISGYNDFLPPSQLFSLPLLNASNFLMTPSSHSPYTLFTPKAQLKYIIFIIWIIKKYHFCSMSRSHLNLLMLKVLY